LADVKLVNVTKFAIGYDADNCEVVEALVRVSDRLISPEGGMVEPIPVIGATKPATVAQRGRYWEIEVEVDSDNITAFRETDVDNAASDQFALQDSEDNDAIEYFLVNYKNSAGTTVSKLFESGRVYLTYARGRVTNEQGVDRHTTTYRFICRGNRTIGSTAIAGTASHDEQYIGITKIAVNGTDMTKIRSYEWEFCGPDGGDIVTPRITPNTEEPVGVTEWDGKHWKIRIEMDTYDTTWIGSLINDDGANTALTSFAVTLTTTTGTRVHTYQANKVYVINGPDDTVSERSLYNPGVIDLICIGTRTDTST